MEHRPLTDPRALLVRKNALATYLGLVASVEGSQVTKPGGYTLVRGPGVFSFCNFAASFDLPPDSLQATIEDLKQNAADWFGFYVFVMSGDGPDDLADHLISHGFELRQELVGMHSTAAADPAQEDRLCPVTDPLKRQQLAEFMARQFFWRMPAPGRRAIASATAASPHTLWSLGDPLEPDAAVMLVEEPDSIGLFNLCVLPEKRNKGLGANLVRHVQRSAASLGRPVVLQCEPELAPWYRQFGFEPVSVVKAFTFDSGESSDIL